MHAVSSTTAYQLFVGVDIAAATAAVAWQAPHQKPGKPITIEQTPEGFALLHQRLTKAGRSPGFDPGRYGSNWNLLVGPGDLFDPSWLRGQRGQSRPGALFCQSALEACPQPTPSMHKPSPSLLPAFSLICGRLLRPSMKSWSNDSPKGIACW